jgi:hypothetical protein
VVKEGESSLGIVRLTAPGRSAKPSQEDTRENARKLHASIGKARVHQGHAAASHEIGEKEKSDPLHNASAVIDSISGLERSTWNGATRRALPRTHARAGSPGLNGHRPALRRAHRVQWSTDFEELAFEVDWVDRHRCRS